MRVRIWVLTDPELQMRVLDILASRDDIDHVFCSGRPSDLRRPAGTIGMVIMPFQMVGLEIGKAISAIKELDDQCQICVVCRSFYEYSMVGPQGHGAHHRWYQDELSRCLIRAIQEIVHVAPV